MSRLFLDHHLRRGAQFIQDHGPEAYEEYTARLEATIQRKEEQLSQLHQPINPLTQWQEVTDILRNPQLSKYLINRHSEEYYELLLSQSTKYANDPSTLQNSRYSTLPAAGRS